MDGPWSKNDERQVNSTQYKLFLIPWRFVRKMNITVRVVPNSKRFKVSAVDKEQNNVEFVIHTKSKAEEDKANLEIIKKLKKILKRNVSIINGLKSRKKIIYIDWDESLEKMKEELKI